MKKVREEIEVEKFKWLIKDMFRGYPNYRYFKIVENIIKTEESRNDLIEAKILISGKYRDEQGNAQDGYSLGANALPLVSAWNNEELAKDTRNFTKSINNLTIWLLFLTGITVLLTALIAIKTLY